MSAKILIVEDNPDQRDFLAILLRQQGYAVATAIDGLEGIHQARNTNPDLIVCDITMPNLDGIDMVRALRKIPVYRNTPVLMLSAYGTNKLFEALDAGANHVMRKPLDFDLFSKAINRLLAQTHENY